MYKTVYWVDTKRGEEQLKHRHTSDASGQFELMVYSCWHKLVVWRKSAVFLHTVKPTQVRGHAETVKLIHSKQVRIRGNKILFDVPPSKGSAFSLRFSLGCRGPEASSQAERKSKRQHGENAMAKRGRTAHHYATHVT